jgi:type IV secretory pathway VirB10-like protein
MKDLKDKITVPNPIIKNAFFTTKVKALLFLIAAGIIIVSVAVIYFTFNPLSLSNLQPKFSKAIGDVDSKDLTKQISEDYDFSYVMNDKFFGKKAEEEEDIEPPAYEEPVKPIKNKEDFTSENLFVEPQAPVKKPIVQITVTQTDSGQQTEIVTYDKKSTINKGSVLELMTDKDYPKTIASKKYDLSRVLTTDMFIPAVMYTAVNSEIPSKTVVAVVESDVSGFHGRNILIPRGSKIEGVYEKIDNKHARRMQITWFKITRPDGIMIKLDSESADSHGAGGMIGYLDQRLKDRYGGALMLSSINALAQMSVDANNVRQLAVADSFSREFGTLTAQVIKENMNAMPIITINQGQRFNIRPYQNIYFREPDGSNESALFVDN